MAIVVVDEDSRITAQEILSAFKGRLARFKHPKAVGFVSALPRNVMGKVQKHELRRALGDGSIALIQR